MRRSLVIAALLFALFPASAVAKCRFACVAHKVTDLKFLVSELEERIEDDEERISQLVGFTVAFRNRSDALEAANTQLAARFDKFRACLGEIPLTRYGQEEGPSGYLFQFSESQETRLFPTTALDISYDNSPVGAWVFVDACNQSRVTQQSAMVPRGPEPAARFGAP